MRRNQMFAGGLCVGLFGLSLVLVNCGGGNVLSPQFQPQVNNVTDNFQFQATGVTKVTQTLNYTWQNTGTAASVNQATTLTAGSATLNIFDASGTQVYTRSLTENGTFATSSGTTGNWRINLVLSNYSGTLNFRVQKNP